MKEIKNNSYFKTAPIGRLLSRFAVSSVISLLVNSLYNIVDQIFIGRDVGYLGNGATTVVFSITVIATAFALLIGDGGATYLRLKIGEGQKEKAEKGIGNSIVLLIAASMIMLAAFLLFLNPLLDLFGATDATLFMRRSMERL